MSTNRLFLILVALFLNPFSRLLADTLPPAEWVDPDTGHRVVRLHIGLEKRDDLLADLEQALKKLTQ